MPTLSYFYGITIRMYWRDHPPPHFHAEYGEYIAVYDIQTLEVREGYLPGRANQFVLEWIKQHQQELLEAWNLCSIGQPATKIAPLL